MLSKEALRRLVGIYSRAHEMKRWERVAIVNLDGQPGYLIVLNEDDSEFRSGRYYLMHVSNLLTSLREYGDGRPDIIKQIDAWEAKHLGGE